MADSPRVEFKVIESRELVYFSNESAFVNKLAVEEGNGWTVVGFACGPRNCYHALLRRETS